MSDRLPAHRRSAPPDLVRAAASPAAAAAALVGAVVVGLVVAVAAQGAGVVVLGVVLGAILGWLARVTVALARGATVSGARSARIDPFTLSEPWRHFVRGALQAQARYQARIAATPPGPLHDRLVDIGRRIDAGVLECWRVAQRGDALEDAVGALDVPGTRRRLEALAAADDDATTASVTGALEARLASAERMRAVADEARDALRVLDARLGEAVARGVELSVHDTAGPEAVGLGADVDDLVLELTALRAALEETTQGPPPTGPDTDAAGN